MQASVHIDNQNEKLLKNDDEINGSNIKEKAVPN